MLHKIQYCVVSNNSMLLLWLQIVGQECWCVHIRDNIAPHELSMWCHQHVAPLPQMLVVMTATYTQMLGISVWEFSDCQEFKSLRTIHWIIINLLNTCWIVHSWQGTAMCSLTSVFNALHCVPVGIEKCHEFKGTHQWQCQGVNICPSALPSTAYHHHHHHNIHTQYITIICLHQISKWKCCWHFKFSCPV